MVEILKKITDKRTETIQSQGISFGLDIPATRRFPLALPDLKEGVIICEVKRGSPSEGRMDTIENPVEWVKTYQDGGASVISVLTEPDFFFGSLTDLMAVKEAYPELPVLRKDFLQHEEEIELSYRAGADLVLLITALFEDNIQKLKAMKEKAEELGMLPLIEVHDRKELELILPLNPRLIGINSRDLRTFKIDKNYPLALKNLTGTADVIFESGIKNSIDSFFVGSNDFKGILVGTSLVKSGSASSVIGEIKAGYQKGRANPSSFYKRLFKKMYLDKQRIVKICGITNLEDAGLAASKGADILGFILAESPRQVDLETVRRISNAIGPDVLKVAVVTDPAKAPVEAVKEGWLDAIQFHGNFDASELSGFDVCWYQALRVGSTEDIDTPRYSPLVLYDAFVKGVKGGTGNRIDGALLDYAGRKGIKMALAGGITPDNVEEIIKNYNPVMIDVSSGLEEAPGKKDPRKVERFFEKVNELADLS